jgi:hypothetical protein
MNKNKLDFGSRVECYESFTIDESKENTRKLV